MHRRLGEDADSAHLLQLLDKSVVLEQQDDRPNGATNATTITPRRQAKQNGAEISDDEDEY